MPRWQAMGDRSGCCPGVAGQRRAADIAQPGLQRMTRRPARRPVERATECEVGVVAAVLVAGSEKAAADCLGLSPSTVKHHLANARSKVGAATRAQLAWILAPRLPEPEGLAQTDERRCSTRPCGS